MKSQPALLVPIVIRGRTVLVLYGDRGGERFDTSDFPELMAFLPRVTDAFEALILKRKRKGYAAPDKAKRAELKSAATKLGAGAVASEAEPPRAGYRTSAPPERRSGAPRSSPSEAPAPFALERRRKNSSPLEVLGVPRSAPPPPMTDDPSEPASTKAVKRVEALRSDPGGETRLEEVEQDEPELIIRVGEGSADEDEDDGLDDFETHPDDEGEDDGDAELPGFAKSVSGRPVVSAYSLRDAGSESVSGGRAARSDRSTDRPPKRPGSSADPRREDVGRAPTDVVHVPDGTVPPSSIPPTTEPVVRRSATPQPSPNMPSVIIDMGDTVEALVDDLTKCGPDDEGSVVVKLLAIGEASLPTLTQRFPGPLWFDRKRPHRRLPRGRDVSAIARAIVAFRERAVPYIASLLDAHDSDARFYATLIAAELVHKDLIAPISLRVFDPDPGTQLLVLDVLRMYSGFQKELEEALKGIRVEARVDRRDPDRRRTAVRALGQLRDPKSLGLLIELLASDDSSLALEAHRALVTLTRQDFAESARKWSQWADRNAERHRIEWLIDGLGHADEEIREAAIEELKLLTQEYYGYHPRMSKRDREIAQRKYRAWWDGEGRARFG